MAKKPMKKKPAKHAPPKQDREQWLRFTDTMHQIAALQAQLAGVKLDIDELQRKVLAVAAVMTAQLTSSMGAFDRKLDELAKHRRGK